MVVKVISFVVFSHTLPLAPQGPPTTILYPTQAPPETAKTAALAKIEKTALSEAAFRGGQASLFHFPQRFPIAEIFTILSGILTGYFRQVKVFKNLGGKKCSRQTRQKNSGKSFCLASLEHFFPPKNLKSYGSSCKIADMTNELPMLLAKNSSVMRAHEGGQECQTKHKAMRGKMKYSSLISFESWF